MAREKISKSAVTDGLEFSRVNTDITSDTAELIKKLQQEKEQAEADAKQARKEAEIAKKERESKTKRVQILITPSTYENIKKHVAEGKASSMNDFINNAIIKALSN